MGLRRLRKQSTKDGDIEYGKTYPRPDFNSPPLLMEKYKIEPVINITINCNINDDPEKIKEFAKEVRKAMQDAYMEIHAKMFRDHARED